MDIAFQNTAIAGFCLFLYAWFAIGTKSIFRNPGGQGIGLLFVGAGATLTATAIIASLLLAQPLSTSRTTICTLILLGSLALFRWTANAIKKTPFTIAFSPDLPWQVVKHGPYRWIRHPFYLAYLSGFFAGVLAVPNLLTTTLFICTTVIYLWAAAFEERKFSRSQLAGEYAIYRNQTGLMVPWGWWRRGN